MNANQFLGTIGIIACISLLFLIGYGIYKDTMDHNNCKQLSKEDCSYYECRYDLLENDYNKEDYIQCLQIRTLKGKG